MKSVSLLLVAGMLLGLWAPTLSASEKPRPKILESWVGRDVFDLTSKWGEPDEVFISQSNQKLLSYSKSRIVEYTALAKDVVFTVDKNDVILKAEWSHAVEDDDGFPWGWVLIGAGVVVVVLLARVIYVLQGGIGVTD